MTSLSAIVFSASVVAVLAPRRSSDSGPFSFKKDIRLSSPPLGFRAKKGEGDFGGGELEAEIYDFMERSENPSAFPTREELIAAGRGDLAEAIAREGGWFAFGWDLEVEQEGEDNGISEPRSPNGPWEREDSTEMQAEEEVVGVEVILSGLERERNLFYGLGSQEKRVNGKASWKVRERDRGDDVLVTNRKAVSCIDRSSMPISLGIDEQLFLKFEGAPSQERISADFHGTSTRPICSFQRDGNPETEFEAAEFVPNEEGNVNHNFNDNISVEGKGVTQSGSKIGEESRDTCSDTEEICQNQMHLHLKHLESELTSALHLLRSRSKDSDSYKSIIEDQISSLKELPMLSDELEFKQTEIMHAKDKLRSLRAKSVIQQGKMTHAIIEARNERKKRLDASLKYLHLLRSTCIVWRGFASEVHLAGSFDGWTSQKTMERSRSGMFTLHLKLYPGRYEIKFIVDGVWMIDPLRPTVYNNGYENNLLLIP